jgi:hypothetical protein
MATVLVGAFISNAGADMIELSYSDNGLNWGVCPIAQQSAAPVSLGTFNDFLWTAFRGHNTSNLYVSSSSNWGVGNDTGQSTQLAPSLAVFGGQLWIAYIGEDTGHVEVVSSGNGTSWSKSVDTGQSSKVAPSLEVSQNQLWIVYVGEDTGHVEVISSGNGSSWSKSVDTGQSSKVAASLTGFQNQLWIAYIGEDTGHVEVISSASGSSWSKSTATGQSSNLPPSVTAFENQLWIGYLGESSGHFELISSSNGTGWSQKIDTGQSSSMGPTLAAVPAVQPPSGLGGSVQYLLASPRGNGWPNSNSPLPPISQLLLYIQITEELTFDPSKPLSFQLNCCAPANGNWKIGWQQYVLMMQPNSTQMFLHIQNFGRNNAPAVYAGNSSNQINFPNAGSIPAGWHFQLALQISGVIVTGASCVVSDSTGATVGVLTLNSIGLPLALQSGTVDESWLAPVVIFQLVVVGYAEGTHTTFTAGSGTILIECSTPIVAGNTWAGSNCAGGGGTAESSNCVYSALPDVANTGVVQCFGAPPSV